LLKSAMGVAGDITRGAFWWAGGEDRININCETGKVKIKNALETPALKADIIQGLSTTTLRIENNMVVSGNLTVNGDIISSSLNQGGTLTADDVYTKAEIDTTFADVSASLGQKALLTDVNLQNEFRIYSSSQSNALTIKKTPYDGFKLTFDPDLSTSCLTMNNCQGGGGCFRAVAPQVGLEASIGLYKHSDMRANDAGDMWVAGLNSWATNGYTIGTTGTGACLNIRDDGVVDVPFVFTTQELMTDTIRAQTAEFINIADNVVITGSLTVNGILDAGATVVSNPFWVAGKVNGNNLDVINSAGRYGYTVSRPATFPTGVYKITFDYAYTHSHYIINTTNQATGTCKVWDYTPPTNEWFHIVTYNTDNVVSNSIFHFSVIA
jgi:hypothetical protein